MTGLLGDFGGDPFEYDLIAVPDPLTGGTRLIAGNINGVWTGVAGSNGQLLQNIGDVVNNTVASTSADVPIVTFTRNGNLQIAQFYYGAVQPNSAGGPGGRGPVLRPVASHRAARPIRPPTC